MDEKKWLGITQSFQRALGEKAQFPTGNLQENQENPELPGMPVPEEYSVVCNKENQADLFDDFGRKEISKIPSSQITSDRVKVNKSHFTKSLHLPPNEISRERRGKFRSTSTGIESDKKAKKNAEKTEQNPKSSDSDPIAKYSDCNPNAERGMTEMEAKLKEMSRRLMDKSRQVEEQKLIISELRTKLLISTIDLSGNDRLDIVGGSPEKKYTADEADLKDELSGLNKTPCVQRATNTDLLVRVKHLEEKMKAFAQDLPEKIEGICLKILSQELNGVRGEIQYAGESTTLQSKWNLSPNIKPKSNLATKLRMNFKGGCRDPGKESLSEVEQKIKCLENTVEQLKNSMFMMILKSRCVN